MTDPNDTAADAQPVKLAPAQLRRLAQAVAVAVADAMACSGAPGRSCYSIAEVARRAGVSDDYVRKAVARGLLRVVRLGGRDTARVTPEDEHLWVTGRLRPDDEPAEGLSPKIARRNRTRAIVGSVLKKSRRAVVHKLKV